MFGDGSVPGGNNNDRRGSWASGGCVGRRVWKRYTGFIRPLPPPPTDYTYKYALRSK
ncbi:hypothetical protein SK128_028289, partial [Halocaridina rubra]